MERIAPAVCQFKITADKKMAASPVTKRMPHANSHIPEAPASTLIDDPTSHFLHWVIIIFVASDFCVGKLKLHRLENQIASAPQ
ncbi:MAG: hypothetical protein ACOYLN_16420, partial [Blastocatellia bacterium]